MIQTAPWRARSRPIARRLSVELLEMIKRCSAELRAPRINCAVSRLARGTNDGGEHWTTVFIYNVDIYMHIGCLRRKWAAAAATTTTLRHSIDDVIMRAGIGLQPNNDNANASSSHSFHRTRAHLNLLVSNEQGKIHYFL